MIVDTEHEFFAGNSAEMGTLTVRHNTTTEIDLANYVNYEDDSEILVINRDVGFTNTFYDGSYGHTTAASNGKVNYTPPDNYIGTDYITFEAVTTLAGITNPSTGTYIVSREQTKSDCRVYFQVVNVARTMSVNPSAGQTLSSIQATSVGTVLETDIENPYAPDTSVPVDKNIHKSFPIYPEDYDVDTFEINGVDVPMDGSMYSVDLTYGKIKHAYLNNDHQFTYEPTLVNDNYSEPVVDTFTYSITNPGPVSGTEVLEATGTVTLTITNTPPVLSSGNISTDEDTESVVQPWQETDVNGDMIEVRLVDDGVTDNGNAVIYGAPGVTGYGFSYIPDLNFNGDDVVKYQVREYDNTVANPWSAEAQWNVTVNPVEDKPVANPLSVTTDEDVFLDITLTSTDVEDAFSRYYEITTNPTNGTVAMEGQGGNVATARYTPNLHFNGTDSFTYKVYEDLGGGNRLYSDDPATVNITVTAVDDPIEWIDVPVSYLSITEHQLGDPSVFVEFPVQAADADDTDVEINVETQGSSGTVTLTAGDAAPHGNTSVQTGEKVPYTVRYTLNDTFRNETDAAVNDNFTLRASSSSGVDDKVVTIGILPRNDTPVVTTEHNISYNENDSVAKGIDLSTLVQEEEGNPLTYHIDTDFSDADHELVTSLIDTPQFLSTVVYSYSPDPIGKLATGVTEQAYFRWYAKDTLATPGSQNSNIGQVNITVTGVNDPPVASNLTQVVDEDEVFEVDGADVAREHHSTLTGVTDPDDNVLTDMTYTFVDGDNIERESVSSDKGTYTLTHATNGTYKYVYDANVYGQDSSVTWRVTDDEGLFDDATIAYNIIEQNDPITIDQNNQHLPEIYRGETHQRQLTYTDVDAHLNDVTWEYYVADNFSNPSGLDDGVSLSSTGLFKIIVPDDTYQTPNGAPFEYFVRVDDGRGSVSPSIKVHGLVGQRDPVTSTAQFAIDHNTTTSINLVPFATDADFDITKYHIVAITGLTKGSISSPHTNTTGVFTFTPHADAYGSNSFNFRVEDSAEQFSNTSVATLTVAEDVSASVRPHLTAVSNVTGIAWNGYDSFTFPDFIDPANDHTEHEKEFRFNCSSYLSVNDTHGNGNWSGWTELSSDTLQIDGPVDTPDSGLSAQTCNIQVRQKWEQTGNDDEGYTPTVAFSLTTLARAAKPVPTMSIPTWGSVLWWDEAEVDANGVGADERAISFTNIDGLTLSDWVITETSDNSYISAEGFRSNNTKIYAEWENTSSASHSTINYQVSFDWVTNEVSQGSWSDTVTVNVPMTLLARPYTATNGTYNGPVPTIAIADIGAYNSPAVWNFNGNHNVNVTKNDIHIINVINFNTYSDDQITLTQPTYGDNVFTTITNNSPNHDPGVGVAHNPQEFSVTASLSWGTSKINGNWGPTVETDTFAIYIAARPTNPGPPVISSFNSTSSYYNTSDTVSLGLAGTNPAATWTPVGAGWGLSVGSNSGNISGSITNNTLTIGNSVTSKNLTGNNQTASFTVSYHWIAANGGLWTGTVSHSADHTSNKEVSPGTTAADWAPETFSFPNTSDTWNSTPTVDLDKTANAYSYDYVYSNWSISDNSDYYSASLNSDQTKVTITSNNTDTDNQSGTTTVSAIWTLTSDSYGTFTASISDTSQHTMSAYPEPTVWPTITNGLSTIDSYGKPYNHDFAFDFDHSTVSDFEFKEWSIVSVTASSGQAITHSMDEETGAWTSTADNGTSGVVSETYTIGAKFSHDNSNWERIVTKQFTISRNMEGAVGDPVNNISIADIAAWNSHPAVTWTQDSTTNAQGTVYSFSNGSITLHNDDGEYTAFDTDHATWNSGGSYIDLNYNGIEDDKIVAKYSYTWTGTNNSGYTTPASTGEVYSTATTIPAYPDPDQWPDLEIRVFQFSNMQYSDWETFNSGDQYIAHWDYGLGFQVRLKYATTSARSNHSSVMSIISHPFDETSTFWLSSTAGNIVTYQWDFDQTNTLLEDRFGEATIQFTIDHNDSDHQRVEERTFSLRQEYLPLVTTEPTINVGDWVYADLNDTARAPITIQSDYELHGNPILGIASLPIADAAQTVVFSLDPDDSTKVKITGLTTSIYTTDQTLYLSIQHGWTSTNDAGNSYTEVSSDNWPTFIKEIEMVSVDEPSWPTMYMDTANTQSLSWDGQWTYDINFSSQGGAESYPLEHFEAKVGTGNISEGIAGWEAVVTPSSLSDNLSITDDGQALFSWENTSEDDIQTVTIFFTYQVKHTETAWTNIIQAPNTVTLQYGTKPSLLGENGIMSIEPGFIIFDPLTMGTNDGESAYAQNDADAGWDLIQNIELWYFEMGKDSLPEYYDLAGHFHDTQDTWTDGSYFHSSGWTGTYDAFHWVDKDNFYYRTGGQGFRGPILCGYTDICLMLKPHSEPETPWMVSYSKRSLGSDTNNSHDPNYTPDYDLFDDNRDLPGWNQEEIGNKETDGDDWHPGYGGYFMVDVPDGSPTEKETIENYLGFEITKTGGIFGGTGVGAQVVFNDGNLPDYERNTNWFYPSTWYGVDSNSPEPNRLNSDSSTGPLGWGNRKARFFLKKEYEYLPTRTVDFEVTARMRMSWMTSNEHGKHYGWAEFDDFGVKIKYRPENPVDAGDAYVDYGDSQTMGWEPTWPMETWGTTFPDYLSIPEQHTFEPTFHPSPFVGGVENAITGEGSSTSEPYLTSTSPYNAYGTALPYAGHPEGGNFGPQGFTPGSAQFGLNQYSWEGWSRYQGVSKFDWIFRKVEEQGQNVGDGENWWRNLIYGDWYGVEPGYTGIMTDGHPDKPERYPEHTLISPRLTSEIVPNVGGQVDGVEIPMNIYGTMVPWHYITQDPRYYYNRRLVSPLLNAKTGSQGWRKWYEHPMSSSEVGDYSHGLGIHDDLYVRFDWDKAQQRPPNYYDSTYGLGAGELHVDPAQYNFSNAIEHIFLPVYFEYAVPLIPITGRRRFGNPNSGTDPSRTIAQHKAFYGGYRGTHESQVHIIRNPAQYNLGGSALWPTMSIHYDIINHVPSNGDWSGWNYPIVEDPEDAFNPPNEVPWDMKLHEQPRIADHSSGEGPFYSYYPAIGTSNNYFESEIDGDTGAIRFRTELDDNGDRYQNLSTEPYSISFTVARHFDVYLAGNLKRDWYFAKGLVTQLPDIPMPTITYESFGTLAWNSGSDTIIRTPVFDPDESDATIMTDGYSIDVLGSGDDGYFVYTIDSNTGELTFSRPIGGVGTTLSRTFTVSAQWTMQSRPGYVGTSEANVVIQKGPSPAPHSLYIEWEANSDGDVLTFNTWVEPLRGYVIENSGSWVGRLAGTAVPPESSLKFYFIDDNGNNVLNINTTLGTYKNLNPDTGYFEYEPNLNQEGMDDILYWRAVAEDGEYQSGEDFQFWIIGEEVPPWHIEYTLLGYNRDTSGPLFLETDWDAGGGDGYIDGIRQTKPASTLVEGGLYFIDFYKSYYNSHIDNSTGLPIGDTGVPLVGHVEHETYVKIIGEGNVEVMACGIGEEFERVANASHAVIMSNSTSGGVQGQSLALPDTTIGTIQFYSYVDEEPDSEGLGGNTMDSRGDNYGYGSIGFYFFADNDTAAWNEWLTTNLPAVDEGYSYNLGTIRTYDPDNSPPVPSMYARDSITHEVISGGITLGNLSSVAPTGSPYSVYYYSRSVTFNAPPIDEGKWFDLVHTADGLDDYVVSIWVNELAENEAPSINSATLTTFGDAYRGDEKTVHFTATDVNIEYDTLTWTAEGVNIENITWAAGQNTGTDVGVTFDVVTGSFSLVGQEYSLTVRVNDGYINSNDWTITGTIVNSAPQIIGQAVSIAVGDSGIISAQLASGYNHENDTVTYRIEPEDVNTAIGGDVPTIDASTGTVFWDPQQLVPFGPYMVKVSVTDYPTSLIQTGEAVWHTTNYTLGSQYAALQITDNNWHDITINNWNNSISGAVGTYHHGGITVTGGSGNYAYGSEPLVGDTNILRFYPDGGPAGYSLGGADSSYVDISIPQHDFNTDPDENTVVYFLYVIDATASTATSTANSIPEVLGSRSITINNIQNHAATWAGVLATSSAVSTANGVWLTIASDYDLSIGHLGSTQTLTNCDINFSTAPAGFGATNTGSGSDATVSFRINPSNSSEVQVKCDYHTTWNPVGLVGALRVDLNGDAAGHRTITWWEE